MTPTERFLAALEERDCNPTPNSNGWSARCPAHEDRRPSLSVSEGTDGKVVFWCHAGCTFDNIRDAMGLSVAELMPDGSSAVSASTQPRRNGKKPQYRRPDGRKPTSYETLEMAIKTLERKRGKRSGLWTYHNVDGDPISVVIRWDKEGEKDFYPVSRHGERWTISGMAVPRPLYHLPKLGAAERVFITEGEKAVEAARAIGLTATTSVHGCKSADMTDWSPLAGKECVILPDNDESGEKYANEVLANLQNVMPPPIVKIVKLPGLPESGDIVEWVEAHPEFGAAELREELDALIDKTEFVKLEKPVESVDRFQPFPTDVLPEPIRGFVVAGAKAIGCDSSYLALPMLTALAAAIGNTRQIQLKRGWTEPAIVWTALVGDSGTMKSPALDLVLKATRDKQRKAYDKYLEQMVDYDSDLLQYDRELAAWKKTGRNVGELPKKPEEPVAERFWCDDQTIEALAMLLLNQPRGLLMIRDELSGWIGGFDRYSQGKGGDVARWLEMFGGRSIMVDRKTGNPPTLLIPRAAVSVTGGIQPGIMGRCFGQQHRENGLAARLLLAYPPRNPKVWTEDDIDPDLESQMAGVLSRLYSLSTAVDEDGAKQPVLVCLTPDAKNEWVKFYNEHAREQAELVGDLSAAWSKLEGYAARLALVIHFARWAANAPDLVSPDEVDFRSIKAGIRLSRWFGHEARRIYSILDETEDESEKRRLIEWIERKGGKVTTREVQQGHRKYRKAEDARVALEDLVKAGYGEWESTPPGRRGQPTRRFVLSAVYGNTVKPKENCNTVDVDNKDVFETQPDDDSGGL